MGLIKFKLVALFTLFLFGTNGISQDVEIIEKAKVKVALSFSAGFLTENTQTTQLHGVIGFRPKMGKVELRGDGFYFLNSFGDRPRFSMNHQLFAGAFYRFSNKNFQPYIGLQPGVAYSQSNEIGTFNSETSKVEYQKTFNPVFSAVGGVELYASKLFYMFAETRYIMGKHKSNGFPVFLDELRFSFGLGFHI